MKRCYGRIKLLKTINGHPLNEAWYQSRSERWAIIEAWRLLYADKMLGFWFQIAPGISKDNDNKWSDRV